MPKNSVIQLWLTHISSELPNFQFINRPTPVQFQLSHTPKLPGKYKVLEREKKKSKICFIIQGDFKALLFRGSTRKKNSLSSSTVQEKSRMCVGLPYIFGFFTAYGKKL